MHGYQDLDEVFDAFANAHRRDIIVALSLQPHSISQLASKQHLSLPAIHKHIRVLEGAELVIRKKVGRTNFLSLRRARLRELQEWLGRFNPYWGSDEETLENYVQQMDKQEPDKEEQE
ncbi:MAG: winged helix-turn-helix transcriptional regulator [Acidimicrobiia bacterium]|nr:winged helix-turn-helix transcriptional regulator [Acidimicrobiia bacterium]